MPSYVQQILSPDPLYLQTKSYTAQADRKPFADFLNPGVVNFGDYAVTVVSGMTLQIAAGAAWVAGQNISDQGYYRQYMSGAVQLACTAAHGTYPRLDQVILRVLDNAADGSGVEEARIEIVPGTPSAGATLDNRTGAANLTTLLETSKSLLLLSDVLVPAQASSLVAGNLRDKRPFLSVKGSAALPVGGMFDYAGSSDPVANMIVIADGRAVSRFNYKTAFDTLGTTFGAGDGSTTFNLPNFTNRSPVGSGGSYARGATGGAATHQLSSAEMPSHSHGGVTQNNSATTDAQGTHAHVPSDGHAFTTSQSETAALGSGSTSRYLVTGTRAETSYEGNHSHNVNSHGHAINAEGGNGAHNNMHPYLACPKAIRIL